MKLQEGCPFIVADGREYLEAEPIECPGGEAAVLSDLNPSENEKNEDAIGIARVNGLVFGAVADGVGSLPDSGMVASAYIREALNFAFTDCKNGPRISPKWVNLRAIEAVKASCPAHFGATVGTFFVVNSHGRVEIHRFGDTEFAHGVWENDVCNLRLAPRASLMPQNQALERYGRGEIVDRSLVLNPKRPDRIVTHFLRRNDPGPITKTKARLQLRPGDWLSITTDGARVYKAPDSYERWLNNNPDASPQDLAHFASCMVLSGTDNGSGFFYRQKA